MNNLLIIKQSKLIRNLTDENFLNFEIEPSFYYKEDSKELIEIGLSRKISIKYIEEIFLKAQDLEEVRKFWNIKEVTPVHLDGYLGINLHHFLRLSPAEASRPELWNSVIFETPEARDYVNFRINFGSTKTKRLKRNDLFLKQSSQVHNLNKISGPWWVVELTRNGEDYQSSKNAFLCTTYFTDRYMTMNLMHYRQIAIGMANYFYKDDNARDLLATRDPLGNPQFSATLNDYLVSKNIEIEFKNIQHDFDKFIVWQNSKKNSNIVKDGPRDFKVSTKELDKVYRLFDTLIAQRK